MRGRSYSYSPSPRRYHSRRRQSPSPRDRYGARSKDLPTSLLVRNLRHDCREPREFGFIQYLDPDDAVEAKYQMDDQILLGRELTVVFAVENRKKPLEMRSRDRSMGSSFDRRRSPLRYSRSPRYGQSYYHSPSYYSPSPRRGRDSRSISPRDRRYREWSHSGTPYGSSRSRSPVRSRSRSPNGYLSLSMQIESNVIIRAKCSFFRLIRQDTCIIDF